MYISQFVHLSATTPASSHQPHPLHLPPPATSKMLSRVNQIITAIGKECSKQHIHNNTHPNILWKYSG